MKMKKSQLSARVVRTAAGAIRRPGLLLGQVRRLQTEAAHVKKLVENPVFADESASRVRWRLANRTEAFLEMIRRAILEYADSPYRPLLQAAGHDYASVERLVRSLGVEGALRRLSNDGVYVAIEEFKGREPARRGGATFRFTPADFNNPLIRSGLLAASGGTRSGHIPTTISVEDHRAGAEQFAAALHAYGLSGRPVAVWLAHGHGASLWAIAALAALRAPAVSWFTLVKEGGMFFSMLSEVARLYGLHLPRLAYAPFHDARKVLAWVSKPPATGGCSILATASLACRLALEAKAAGVSLAHVTFITIGEPLTPVKLQAIQDVGGRAFSSLGFTEFGRATYGCAAPIAADDSHLCRDTIAVVQRRRPVDGLGTEVDALLFTSLWPHARKILFNMETGDYASVGERRCGCPLEALGWTEHMHDIRSFEKLNAVGRVFFGSELYELVEETLPRRFGGHPTDYQLLEEEDADAFTRLTVLVHPRLEAVDLDAVVQCVEGRLRRLSPTQAQIWYEADVVQARRQAPLTTAVGKLMPLHHLGAAAAPAGAAGAGS